MPTRNDNTDKPGPRGGHVDSYEARRKAGLAPGYYGDDAPKDVSKQNHQEVIRKQRDREANDPSR
jgi:hypothetical protein